MLSRRRFLLGASGAVVVGVGALARVRAPFGGTETRDLLPFSPEAAKAQEGTFYSVVAPSVGADGFFPELSISQFSPFQGGAILVTATRALSGVARVFGREYVLAPGPEGVAGFVGFGTEDPPGYADLTVHLVDELGAPLNYGYGITVRETAWTFDDIIIPPPPPPDPNAPPPPPPRVLPDDNVILPQLYAAVTPRKWAGPWMIPIMLGGEVWISGYFGEERSFNGGPRGGHHGGTDIAAPQSKDIQATNSGIVVFAEESRVRGNLVAIDHGAGIVSSYGHMSEIRVAVGEEVERGKVIGLVGSTGLSTGPHLHWELAVGGVLVDGLRWLDGTQGF